MKKTTFFLGCLVLGILGTQAQYILPPDSFGITDRIKTDIEFLASEKLGGREAGTEFELLARDYIEMAFIQAGLRPFFADSSFTQAFNYRFGFKHSEKEIRLSRMRFTIDYVYIPSSSNETFYHKTSPYIIYKNDNSLKHANNKALVINASGIKKDKLIYELTRIGDKAAAAGVHTLIYADPDSPVSAYDLSSYGRIISKNMVFVQLHGKPAQKILNRLIKRTEIQIQSQINVETAWNVVGYINNNSTSTIVLGAHYDHLGMGAVNSRHTGYPEFHYGADDNASGTAIIMELARWLSNEKDSRHNYLFVAFSAEEKGLIGSGYFVDNLNYTNRLLCMLNYDMVGRLNDTTGILYLNATGSSSDWSDILKKASHKMQEELELTLNQGGISGSDQLPFYLIEIPVAFFFTGLHPDYHTPYDTPDKINYDGMSEILFYSLNVIHQLNKYDSLRFTRVNIQEQSRTPARSQMITLGIIPDHAFEGEGLRISGVLEERTAEKFGILKDDVIIGIGPHKVTSIESYMKAMSKYKKGDSETIVIIRKGEKIAIELTF